MRQTLNIMRNLILHANNTQLALTYKLRVAHKDISVKYNEDMYHMDTHKYYTTLWSLMYIFNLPK